MALSPLSSPAARGAAAILGAVVADAASRGTHWRDARADVEKAVGGALGSGGEFVHPPVPTYHRLRRAGQPTMYGEGALVLARALAASADGATLSEAAFLAEWKASFGVCGSFAGYADHTTRTTVFKMMAVAAANEAATFPPKDAPEALRGPLFMGVKAAAAELSGAALALRAAAVAAEAGAPQCAGWATEAAAAWDIILRTPVASDDDQSNTLGKLVPAAVAAAGRDDFDARVERAIRVTQENGDVVAWFVPLARAIEAAVLGTAATPRAALEAALPHWVDPARRARIGEALAAADAGEDVWAAIARFGAACGAASTAPLTVFMLARFGGGAGGGFEAAVRNNMAGDSAARACVIGAVLGALGGLPEAWAARLDGATRAETERLAAAVSARLG